MFMSECLSVSCECQCDVDDFVGSGVRGCDRITVFKLPFVLLGYT